MLWNRFAAPLASPRLSLLDRILTRQSRQGPAPRRYSVRRELTPRQRLRRFGLAAFVLIAAAVAYALLPKPGPRLRDMQLTGSDLRAVVARFAAKPPAPAAGNAARAQVEFGRRLFDDRTLSRNGEVACSSCHQADRKFTDGVPVSHGVRMATKNAPSVANGHLQTWFFWDGRADSLAAQALGPLEDPREHGFSRVGVVKRLKAEYPVAYERAFGAFPTALDVATLPDHALPPRPKVELSIDVAATSLATLGHFELLTDILQAAQKARTAPATELNRRALGGPPPEAAWSEAWLAMPEAQRAAVNQVFANFGRALAAFEEGLGAVDSPFDRFAARLGALPPEKPETEALDLAFDAAALEGFKLFAGPARCTLCHDGPAFSDQQFHNTGLGQRGMELDVGRSAGVLFVKADPFNCLGLLPPPDPIRLGETFAGVGPPPAQEIAPGTGPRESCLELPFLDSQNDELIGAFKTPSLRNVGDTAPYMHDGRFATLTEVVEFYDGLESRAALGHREDSMVALDLTSEEKAVLLRFLESLSSPVTDVNRQRLATRP